MTISPQDVRHIAKLARLRISEAEEEKYAKDLTGILKEIDKLQEVDTTGVEPTAQITGLRMIERSDVIRGVNVDADILLACSPLPIVAHQIETPSAHGR